MLVNKKRCARVNNCTHYEHNMIRISINLNYFHFPRNDQDLIMVIIKPPINQTFDTI